MNYSNTKYTKFQQALIYPEECKILDKTRELFYYVIAINQGQRMTFRNLSYDRIQVDHNIAWGIGAGFINIHERSQFLTILH